MPGPQTPAFPMPPSVPATDPLKAAEMRRLAMALMGNAPMAGQQQGQGGELFGGLASGLNAGNRIAQQQQLNDLMGIEPPWKRWFKQEPTLGPAPGGGGAAPDLSYGGPR